MEYECQLQNFNALLLNASGVNDPLCNKCKTPDCSNPIVDQMVSVVGIARPMRVWKMGGTVRQVVSCSGYVGE